MERIYFEAVILTQKLYRATQANKGLLIKYLETAEALLRKRGREPGFLSSV